MTHSSFVICVNGAESDDLQIWKLYPVLADEQGTVERYLRVVDDSGEDYLYPASRFVGVEFSTADTQRGPLLRHPKHPDRPESAP
jgi:hypothetical protein